MKQVMWAVGLGVGLLSGCSGVNDESGAPELTAAEKGEITGGELVGENIVPYSSAVKIWNFLEPPPSVPGGIFCSGVKIGPRRFLFAGHCNVLVNPRPTTGARITITNGLNTLVGTTVTVDRVYPHPTFWVPPTVGFNYETLSTIYDIAVVNVKNDTPSIPALPTDSTFFADGWLGTMVAYGCDQRDGFLPGPNGGKKQTAEFASATLAEFQAGLVRNGYSHTAGREHYMMFDGQPRYPGAPPNFYRRGCYGDSGGPMFRWDNGWKVAGITSHRIVGEGPLMPKAQITATTRVASVASWISSPKIKGAPRSITNALTGKCLGVAGSTTAGAPIVQELCGDRTPTNSSQYWTKEPTRGGYTRFVNGRSGMCMQALAGSIEQRPCNISNTAQDFLILVGSPSLTPLISQNGGYAGVNGKGNAFGSINVNLRGDEATTRMRWIWTP